LELLFKVLYVFTDCWLAGKKLFSCSGEASVFINSCEYFQVPGFDGISLSLAGSG